MEGVYILPSYQVENGKKQARPVITTYYDYKWSCSCKHKTKVAAYTGDFCWHEEWCIKKLLSSLQNLKATTEGNVLLGA